MSSPEPTSKPATRSSNTGRYLFMLLFGLLIGIAATIALPRVWEGLVGKRDPFPDALMQVQGWHMGQLKASMDQNHCNATDVLPHLQALRMTSNDLEAAFPNLADNERFRSAAAAMRAATDKAVTAPPLSCESLAATRKAIGDTCSGCHRDFKN